MTKSSTLLPFTLEENQARIEAQLQLQLSTCAHKSKPLYQAMRYMLLGKAKRIRPLLVYASGMCFGATLDKLDPAAIAVECIHTYSLIHDDLPAMDNDDLRRGQATCHKAFDEATAILAGDALQNLAFEVLSQAHSALTATQQLKLLHTLASASGANGMIAGQMLDMHYQKTTPSFSEVASMHALKTGALIRASVMLGAITAGCTSEQTQPLQEFADNIGLAFQIKDDILDVEGDTHHLGKTSGADQKQQKATAVTTLTLSRAKQKLQQLLQNAEHCLAQLPQNTEALRFMAQYIIQRDC